MFAKKTFGHLTRTCIAIVATLILALPCAASAALDAATFTWEILDLPQGLGALNTPTGIACNAASSGEVWVADSENSRVLQYKNAAWTEFLTALSQKPLYVTYSSASFIAIAASDRVRVYNLNGSQTQTKTLLEDGLFYTGLSSYTQESFVGSISTTFNNSHTYIRYRSTVGGYSKVIDSAAVNSLTMAMDENENIYMPTNGPIYSYKYSDFSYKKQWGTSGTAVGEFGSPQGIFVDASTNMYLADTGNNRVQIYNAASDTWTASGSQGTAAGQFNSPQGICVDVSGVVYVADTGNNRIQRGSPPFAASLAGVPSSPTTARTASITVGGTNVSQYKYSLDSSGWTNATDVATTIELANLSLGDHSLSVVGGTIGDVWQDTSAPTTVTWTVMSGPPTATLTGAPAATTTARTTSITAGGANVTQYRYNLDSTGWTNAATIATPIALSNLALGAHTLFVVGGTVDNVWQDTSAPTTATWTVLTGNIVPEISLLLLN